MSIEGAVKCFAENRSLFEPVGGAGGKIDVVVMEKWNLYNGLLALAEAVRDTQAQIDSLRIAVERRGKP